MKLLGARFVALSEQLGARKSPFPQKSLCLMVLMVRFSYSNASEEKVGSRWLWQFGENFGVERNKQMFHLVS